MKPLIENKRMSPEIAQNTPKIIAAVSKAERHETLRAAEEKEQAWVDQISDFAEKCKNLDQIRMVLNTLSRVSFPSNVMALLMSQPQAEDGENIIVGNMSKLETACERLLTKAFALATNLTDVNHILACDYRFAPKGKIQGTLLYNIGDFLADCLSENQMIRAEIIAARDPEQKRSEVFLDFLVMMKKLEAYQRLAPILLELQTTATRQSVLEIADKYR